MPKLTCVAASARPLINAGYLLPIFRKSDGTYFDLEIGEFQEYGFEKLIQVNAAILLDEIELSGQEYNIPELTKNAQSVPEHYYFNAYVFFFAKSAISSMGKAYLMELALKHSGTILHAKDERWKDHLLFLIKRKNLVEDLVPELLHSCAKRIDDILTQRFRDNCQDDINESQTSIVKLMMNVTDEKRDNLDLSIQYYGALLLLSSFADNYPVWLDFVLNRWNHPIKDVEYWRKLSTGVAIAAKEASLGKL